MSCKIAFVVFIAMISSTAAVSAQEAGTGPKMATVYNAYTDASGISHDAQFVVGGTDGRHGKMIARLRAIKDGNVVAENPCKLVCYGSTCFKPSYCVPSGTVPVPMSVLMTDDRFDMAFTIDGDKISIVRDADAINKLQAKVSASGGALE